MVLKRIRAGDYDLLIKAYSPLGMVDILVREGLIPQSRFFGLFEPFNILQVDLRQQGNVTLPWDILQVDRLSFLCQDFDRFMWMSWICGFILKNVRFYDSSLFDMFYKYLVKNPGKSYPAYRIKLMLDFLELSGIRPKFLIQKGLGKHTKFRLSDGSVGKEGDIEVSPSVVKIIRKIGLSKRASRVRIEPNYLKEAEKVLNLYIEHHTR